MDSLQAVQSESVLDRYIFPSYLMFSVCFYSMRFIFGWGYSGTTLYDSDMPWYLAALKDIAWFVVIGFAVSSPAISRSIAQVKAHPAVYVLGLLLVGWMSLCALLHMFFLEEPLLESMLYNLRMPLEYIPAAALAPAFIGNFRALGSQWKRLNLIAIAFALYELIAVGEGWKQTGFAWGGISTRFGGILGSPNDWGIYCGCAILALFALKTSRIQLLGFVPGLILSQSRSAMVASLVASLALFHKPRHIGRFIMAGTIIGLVLLFAVQLSEISWADILPVHAGLDDSGLERLDQVNEFKSSFISSDNVMAMLIGVRRFHIETFYLALMVRGGMPALVLFGAIIGLTVIRGWKLRQASPVHAAALCVVLVISIASLFIPYPDSYPTNFYLWLAVGILWMDPEPERVTITLPSRYRTALDASPAT